MKRNRSHNDSSTEFVIHGNCVEEDSSLERQNTNLAVPVTGKGKGKSDESPKPSKVRRKGEKLLSALRSLTTSGKSPMSSNAPSLGKSSNFPTSISAMAYRTYTNVD